MDDHVDSDSDSDPERLKEQHLENVKNFFEVVLKAKAVVDRTFFVSGREAYEVQKNGEQPSEGRSVVYMQSLCFSDFGSPSHVQQLSVSNSNALVC